MIQDSAHMLFICEVYSVTEFCHKYIMAQTLGYQMVKALCNRLSACIFQC